MQILIVGGLGTFLAAIELEVWVALTTALAAAFTNKLEIDQGPGIPWSSTTSPLTNLRNIPIMVEGVDLLGKNPQQEYRSVG